MAPGKDRRLLKYLVFAFAIAWVLQIIAGILYWEWQLAGYSAVLAISMLAPLVLRRCPGSNGKKQAGSLHQGQHPVYTGCVDSSGAAWHCRAIYFRSQERWIQI